MTKSELAALAAAALASGARVTRLPALSAADAAARERTTARAIREANYRREHGIVEHNLDADDDQVTVVTDHAGREFLRNSHGEWL
jgi:hypothetical protein